MSPRLLDPVELCAGNWRESMDEPTMQAVEAVENYAKPGWWVDTNLIIERLAVALDALDEVYREVVGDGERPVEDSLPSGT